MVLPRSGVEVFLFSAWIVSMIPLLILLFYLAGLSVLWFMKRQERRHEQWIRTIRMANEQEENARMPNPAKAKAENR
jgi:hypothetical protein